MGMFDTIRVIGDDPRLLCAEGHQLDDLQTKDLDCNCDIYWLYNGVLYRPPGDDEGGARESSWDAGGDVLVRRSTEAFPRCHTTISFLVYSHCPLCRPVVFARGEARGSFIQDGNIDTRQPWCEWRIHLAQGAVEAVSPVRLESRASVREDVEFRGLRVLADDDPIALAHLYSMPAHRHNRWRKSL